MNKYEIVHRDINPKNIMLKEDESAIEFILIDYGLSTLYTDLTENSLMRDKSGTVGYLAPEVLSYKDGQKFYGPKVDVYSLGIVVVELLLKRNPFK